MAARKQSAGKKAMMREAMSKDPMRGGKGLAVGKPGKDDAPHSPKGNHKLSKKSRKKQIVETPEPGAALRVIPKPTAMIGKKRKGSAGGPR